MPTIEQAIQGLTNPPEENESTGRALPEDQRMAIVNRLNLLIQSNEVKLDTLFTIRPAKTRVDPQTQEATPELCDKCNQPIEHILLLDKTEDADDRFPSPLNLYGRQVNVCCGDTKTRESYLDELKRIDKIKEILEGPKEAGEEGDMAEMVQELGE